MRWKAKPKPKIGDERVVTTWCLWPREINGEVRWLQRCRIRQRLSPRLRPALGGHSMAVCQVWVDLGWEPPR